MSYFGKEDFIMKLKIVGIIVSIIGGIVVGIGDLLDEIKDKKKED